MQETKLADKNFPSMAFSALGYDSAPHGHNQWNGVAILSQVGIEDVTTGFDDETVDPYEGDARLVAAKCGGVNVVCVYVPNGREVGTEFYDRKLVWLDVLHDWIAAHVLARRAAGRRSATSTSHPRTATVWSAEGVRGRDPRDGAGARRGAQARGLGPRRRLPRAVPGRTGSSATGTTAGATSTSTAGCASTWC